MKNIALAFSGGGFRAAAFSLGTLSYLDHVPYLDQPLLEQVKFIGSTSGGSITNLMYTAGLCADEPFNIIYKKIFCAMEGEKLLGRVFEILNDTQLWQKRKDKRINLINAFSMAYDEANMLGGKTFGELSENIKYTHLDEITVNATEFTNGISFRFQSQHGNPSFPKGRVGNNYINFKRDQLEVAGLMKLGDLLACSSCFPGGFEPFLFPEDFTHGELNTDMLVRAMQYKTNPFSPPEEEDKQEKRTRFFLMDGGIADNQAIESVLLANKRRQKNKRPTFDLIIATDVTSYFMDGFDLPPEDKLADSGKAGVSPLFIKRTLFVGGCLFLLLVALYFTPYWKSWMYLPVIPMALSLGIWLYLTAQFAAAGKKAKQENDSWLIVLLKYGAYFARLKMNVLKYMILARLKSVLLLANDIYLKQIRRHYYNMVYRDPDLSGLFISNAIYDLSLVKQKASADKDLVQVIGFDSLNDAEDTQIPAPSAALKKVAEKARLVPTTLWFDLNNPDQQLRETIIATGQFTTCYNLLKYLIRLEKISSASPTGEVQPFGEDLRSLKNTMAADWKKFNEDPYFMLPVITQVNPC